MSMENCRNLPKGQPLCKSLGVPFLQDYNKFCDNFMSHTIKLPLQ